MKTILFSFFLAFAVLLPTALSAGCPKCSTTYIVPPGTPLGESCCGGGLTSTTNEAGDITLLLENDEGDISSAIIPAAGDDEGGFGVTSGGAATNLVQTNSNGEAQAVNICDIGPSISSPDVAGNSSGRTDFFSIDGEGVNHPVADTIVDHPAQDVLAKITGDCVKTIKIAVRDHHQDTVYVDGKFGVDATGLRERHDRPFLTIQAAVNAAEDGDEIEVHAGDYAENVSVVGRNLDFEMVGVNWSGTWTIFDQSDVTITGRPNLRFGYNAFRVQSSRASIEADRFIGTGPLGYTFFRNSEVYLDFNYHVGYLQMSDWPTVAAYDGLASRNAERGAPDWAGTYHVSGRESYHGPAELADDRGSNFAFTGNANNATTGPNQAMLGFIDVDYIRNYETATGTPSDGLGVNVENGATAYIRCKHIFSLNRNAVSANNGNGTAPSNGKAWIYLLSGRYESAGPAPTLGSWYSTGAIHNWHVHSGVTLINSGTGSNVGNMAGAAATDLRLYEEVSMDSGISAPTILTHGTADVSANVR